MNKVYYVVIKGRTLESRNLKELLARAVSAKRNLDRGFSCQAQFNRPATLENPSSEFIPVVSEARI
jgi:hypothetical protein